MKYILLIHGNADRQVPQEQLQAEMQQYFGFNTLTREKGAFVAGEQLYPVTAATTLRGTGGSPTITDGPFAETKEVLGGFYILDCKDLDEALDYARKINAIDESTVEIRPLVVFS